jgi:integrase
MNKLTKVLNSVNPDIVRDETKNQKNIKSSQTLNEILKNNYSNLSNSKSSSKLLIEAWNIALKNLAVSGFVSRSWNALFKAITKIGDALYPNLKTASSFYTELRKPIRAKFKDEHPIYIASKNIMGITQKDSLALKEAYKNNVEIRNTNRNNLIPFYVEQILDLINHLKQFYLNESDTEGDNNIFELALAVLLATGSRSIELFKVSKYQAVEDNPNQINIKGIAKDRGNNNLGSAVIHRNLVGLNSSQVIDFVNKIRNKLKFSDLDNKKVKEKTNKKLNEMMIKYIHPILIENAGDKVNTDEFKQQLKNTTAHKTRYIFGNASFLIHGKPLNIPYESYLQRQLGHLNPNTTRSYLGINMKFRNELINGGNEELKELITQNQNKTDSLEQKIEECCPSEENKNNNLNFQRFANKFTRSMNEDEKINNIIEVLKILKSNGIKMKQKDLQKKLRYSSKIFTKAYNKARDENII